MMKRDVILPLFFKSSKYLKLCRYLLESGGGFMDISRTEIADWIHADSPEIINELYRIADRVRYEFVGDEVHLRGLVEFSNYCARDCQYCGIGVNCSDISRYRMSHDEILECARNIVELKYGTMVLQSGEDWGIDTEWMTTLLKRIKDETGLAVTLSVGERTDDELLEWFEAGADRFLLRFETTNQALYEKIHPNLGDKVSNRFGMLKRMREIGYEVGSGAMVGIPGQTYNDVVNDIMMFKELDLDMIGIGPYIPSPGTPLYDDVSLQRVVPGSVDMACRVVALARLVCPKSNIPSTTALATLNGVDGRIQGLSCGANILMPNITPAKYREMYSIYPSKTALNEKESGISLSEWLESIGRIQGSGRGDSINKVER